MIKSIRCDNWLYRRIMSLLRSMAMTRKVAG